MYRKKIISVVLSVVLVTTALPPKAVEASWFSDLCGGLLTIISFPILLIAPDNPTLRKNNPFRKKLWEEQQEIEERFQNYVKRLPPRIEREVVHEVKNDEDILQRLNALEKSVDKNRNQEPQFTPQAPQIDIQEIAHQVLEMIPQTFPSIETILTEVLNRMPHKTPLFTQVVQTIVDEKLRDFVCLPPAQALYEPCVINPVDLEKTVSRIVYLNGWDRPPPSLQSIVDQVLKQIPQQPQSQIPTDEIV